MSSKPAGRQARHLRDAARHFAEAVGSGDPEMLEAALADRQHAFDAFIETAGEGLDSETRQLVEEVLELDRGVQTQARAQLAEIREELERIHSVRRVVAKQTSRQAPRFVSRRA